MGKKLSIIIAAIIIFASAGLLVISHAPTKTGEQIQNVTFPSVVQEKPITYNGREGVNALTLLKEKSPVEQNAAGLVVSINGRKAEESKREYWAFYTNGKMATVGPAEYVTKDTDKIEWKVENY